MNNFADDLKFSLEARQESFWDQVYQKAFVNLERTWLCDDLRYQKMGIDRFVKLTNTRVFAVDEKTRRKDYGDILLEYRSNDKRKRPGWINKDLAIDFLCYGFMDTQRAILFPWPLLRLAWINHGRDWFASAKAGNSGYSHIVAKNRGYNTLSITVPVDELVSRISQAMVVTIDTHNLTC